LEWGRGGKILNGKPGGQGKPIINYGVRIGFVCQMAGVDGRVSEKGGKGSLEEKNGMGGLVVATRVKSDFANRGNT